MCDLVDQTNFPLVKQSTIVSGCVFLAVRVFLRQNGLQHVY